MPARGGSGGGLRPVLSHGDGLHPVLVVEERELLLQLELVEDRVPGGKEWLRRVLRGSGGEEVGIPGLEPRPSAGRRPRCCMSDFLSRV